MRFMLGALSKSGVEEKYITRAAKKGRGLFLTSP
jgi:hypothetical protein